MRLTRLGFGCLLMSGLTLMSAASTGNNLLYLLYSALASAFALSVIAGRLNLGGLIVRAEVPDQVFRGAEFPLGISIRNAGRFGAYGVSVVCGPARAAAGPITPGAASSCELRTAFPYRGLNRLESLFLESAFPFGFLRHRRKLDPVVGLALPRLREIHAAAEIKADAHPSGRPTLRKGAAGEDLYGIRPYDPSDDARAINWKLTAKSGAAVVNEYAAAQDSRVTVGVAGLSGEGAEERIEEAAAACRFYIDTGAEVRLVTPEEEIDHGRGLLHLDKLLRSLALAGSGHLERSTRSVERLKKAAAVEDSTYLRHLTMAGAVLVYASIFLIDEINPLVLIGLSPILPLGWYLQWRRKSLLPDFVWSGLSFFVLVAMLFFDWRASGVTIANTHLLLYLLANRVLNPFKSEEFGQIFLILFLAFFLSSGLTISLWYFLFFVLYLCCAAVWLALAAGVRFESRRGGVLSLGGLVAACLAGSALLFTATPRVEGLRKINPFLAAGIDKLAVNPSAVTGFSENVSLGFFGEMKKSSARVMQVKPAVFPGKGRPAPLRIRGASLDAFDGRRWSKGSARFRYELRGRSYPSWDGRGDAARRGQQLFFPAPAARAGSVVHDFAIYPMGLSVLFTVGTPWLVESENQEAFFDYLDTARFVQPYASGVRYRVHANPEGGGFPIALAEGEARRYLQVPPDPSGRTAALALRITRAAVGTEGKAKAVEGYLRRAYDYSLFSTKKNETLEGFLFSSKRGNCEFFATAGVILLRHAGVPARLVTGFLADDWNEFGHFYDVRQREAHAWMEVYVSGRGWTAFDPTPARGAFSASFNALGQRLNRWFDSVQLEWYRRVIGYDQYVQGNTFRRLGLAFKLETLLSRLSSLRDPALGALLLAALWLSLPKLRALRRARAGFFARAQAALERAGFSREPHLTPREYAARVLGLRPELAEAGALAELHYLERYSGRGLSAAQEGEALRLLDALRARL